MRFFVKKIFIILTSFCLIFALASCRNSEQNNNGGNTGGSHDSPAIEELKFEKTSDGRYYTVAGIGSFTEENIHIPRLYNGIAVKSVSADAFKGNTHIKTLTVDEGVEKIGANAFSGCTSLESVKIAKTLEKINSYAFEGCTSLKTLIFGNGVTDIGKNAFLGCTAIENFYYEGAPGDFTKITGTTWCELTYKTKYTYFSSYPSAAGYFWHWSEDGEPVVWEDYVGNSGLKFELSSDGTYYAVSGNSNLSDKTVRIPKAHKGLPVCEIGAMAFFGSYMEEIIIPDTVTKIAGAAFRLCSSLKTVTLPESIEYIGESAFSECTSLEKIILPKKLKTIGKNAFVPSLEIYYSADADAWSKIGTEDGYTVSSSVYFYSQTEPENEGFFWCFDENGEIKLW